jgi:hypothetical protein
VSSTSITTADDSSDTTCFPVFVNTAVASGQAAKTDAALTFNASTVSLSSTYVVGTTSVSGATIASTGTGTGIIMTDASNGHTYRLYFSLGVLTAVQVT